MTLRLYLKIWALIAITVAMLGIVAPYLISQKSDIAVLLGFSLLIVTPFAGMKAAQRIFK